MFTSDTAREIVRNSYGSAMREILEREIKEVCKRILEECKRGNRKLEIPDTYLDETYTDLACPPYNFRVMRNMEEDEAGYRSSSVEISW